MPADSIDECSSSWLTHSRLTIERKGWRVEVPARVAERMRRMGFEPPPNSLTGFASLFRSFETALRRYPSAIEL